MLVFVFGALMSTVALAQGDSEGVMNLVPLGSALAIGLAVLGAGPGQGRAAAAALEGMARNPNSYDKVFTPMILALALIEFQAIMGFIIAFLLMG